MKSIALDALDRQTMTWFNQMNPRGDVRSFYANIFKNSRFQISNPFFLLK